MRIKSEKGLYPCSMKEVHVRTSKVKFKLNWNPSRILGTTGLTFPLMAWMTRARFLLLGKDLIGVQNLLKKHQALQAEIAGHEPRIKAVTQKGNAMVEEGEWLPSGEWLYYGSPHVLSLVKCMDLSPAGL